MPVKNWTPDVIIDKALDAEEKRMGLAVAVVAGEIQTLLNRGGGRNHTPSKPGEPPRKQSARLYKSIHFKVVREKNQVVGVVYSDDKKARRLEYGFVGRDSLGRKYDQKPRPFMRPGFQKAKDKVTRILKDGKK